MVIAVDTRYQLKEKYAKNLLAVSRPLERGSIIVSALSYGGILYGVCIKDGMGYVAKIKEKPPGRIVHFGGFIYSEKEGNILCHEGKNTSYVGKCCPNSVPLFGRGILNLASGIYTAPKARKRLFQGKCEVISCTYDSCILETEQGQLIEIFTEGRGCVSVRNAYPHSCETAIVSDIIVPSVENGLLFFEELEILSNGQSLLSGEITRDIFPNFLRTKKHGHKARSAQSRFPVMQD